MMAAMSGGLCCVAGLNSSLLMGDNFALRPTHRPAVSVKLYWCGEKAITDFLVESAAAPAHRG
jgi:hypothetical protein